MNLPARGRAAGKVILLGEHAVVYGRPALATGLGLGLTAEVSAGDGALRVETDRGDAAPLARLVREAGALLGLPPDGLVVRIRSELPVGVGLGSSAALSVAVLRAMAAAVERRWSPGEELSQARRLEAIFHGHPSGIDPAAAMLGSCFRFVRGEPPTVVPLRVRVPLALVVAWDGRPRSTGAAVGALRARWEADRPTYEALFDAVGAVVDEGAAAVEAGDAPGLGRAFDRNQTLLERLGVSEAGVEALIASARRRGALGAKLTGGGAGGAIIAVATEPAPVADALAAGGAQTLVVRLGAVAEAA